jgi:multidrug transporter EmrE-like cation transporter
MYYIIIGGVLSALPVVYVKKYIETDCLYFIYIAIIINTLLLYVYSKLFREREASIGYAFVKIISIIMVMAYGMCILGEHPDTNKKIGLILGIFTLYYLS